MGGIPGVRMNQGNLGFGDVWSLGAQGSRDLAAKKPGLNWGVRL